MKIAVLGSGNGGCAVAADCALHGRFDLLILKNFQITSLSSRKQEVFRRQATWKDLVSCRNAGHDIGRAVEGAELIYVVGPSYATVPFARAFKPVMKSGQRVIVCPGTNGGALVFKKELGLAYSDPDIVVAETSTLPYACRILDPGSIHVYLKLRAGLFISALPSSKVGGVAELFGHVYPGSEAYKNVFQTILQNGNNVIHPAVSLLNVGRIESPEDFYFYEQGVTPAVGRLMRAVDEERMAIAAALGVEILSEPEVGYIQGYMLEKNYDTGYSQAPGFKGIKAQTQVDYRYFTEDVGYGLILLTDLGRAVGVSTPIMDALIDLVSVVLKTDYRDKAYRTLATFGMEGLGRDQLLDAVDSGSLEAIE